MGIPYYSDGVVVVVVVVVVVKVPPDTDGISEMVDGMSTRIHLQTGDGYIRISNKGGDIGGCLEQWMMHD